MLETAVLNHGMRFGCTVEKEVEPHHLQSVLQGTIFGMEVRLSSLEGLLVAE